MAFSPASNSSGPLSLFSYFQVQCKDAGVEPLIMTSPSVADPANLYSFWINLENKGKKLVRVGADIFLEPGERVSFGWNLAPPLEVIALNNGI